MTITERQLEDNLCAIAHKAYKLLPEDYHPLLWLYKEQRDLEIQIELLEKHGADADKELINELRREYIAARNNYIRTKEALS